MGSNKGNEDVVAADAANDVTEDGNEEVGNKAAVVVVLKELLELCRSQHFLIMFFTHSTESSLFFTITERTLPFLGLPICQFSFPFSFSIRLMIGSIVCQFSFPLLFFS